MSLQERIEAVNKKAAEDIPEDVRNTMADHVKQLAQSGIVEKSIDVGSKIPDFELPDGEERTISMEDLRARGPVVLSFFRGRW
jgi:RecJ-like exonuclease